MPRPPWHRPPGSRARAWVATALGPGWRIERVRRLRGGVATAADLVRLRGPGGATTELVLRRWLRPGWEAEDPAFTPSHEAAILGRLAGSGLPVPVVVALDPDGAACGAPALLAERLPGRAPSAAGQRAPSRLRALGELLARIHALDLGLEAVAVPFAPYYPLEPRRVPSTTRRAGLWARAYDLVGTGPAAHDAGRFLHRDLHPGNTLWTGGRLSGVVDWTGASWGPPGADLGHLRANLGPDHGIAAADRALAAYAAAWGASPADQPWWDVRMLLDLLDDPDDLAGPALERTEDYLEALLARA
jgi:aminoglycoside phosphotransferase (APT) family kinase protein